jgi:L-lactate dehydrogenase
LATATLVDCIVYDRHKIYPVSSLLNGYYGVDDVCISVPTVIGNKGILRTLELKMVQEEQDAFRNSAKILKDIIKSLKM